MSTIKTAMFIVAVAGAFGCANSSRPSVRSAPNSIVVSGVKCGGVNVCSGHGQCAEREVVVAGADECAHRGGYLL